MYDEEQEELHKLTELYSKGARVYIVVPHVSKDDPSSKTWEIVPAAVQSSGFTYVSVLPDGKKRGTRFPWNNKIIMRHEKNGSFLVPKKAQAEQLITMLEGSGTTGGRVR